MSLMSGTGYKGRSKRWANSKVFDNVDLLKVMNKHSSILKQKCIETMERNVCSK